MPNRAIVTGGSGFIGAHLVNLLLHKGVEVHLLLRSSSDKAKLEKLGALEGSHLHIVSREYNALRTLVTDIRPLSVFHLAASPGVGSASEQITDIAESNILFGLRLLQALSDTGQKVNFINTATYWEHLGGQEYNPVNLYAATKRAFFNLLTLYASNEDIKATTLVLYIPYGPLLQAGKLLSQLKTALKSGKQLPMTPGEQKLNLVHVEDVARGYLIAEQLLAQGNKLEQRYGLHSDDTLSLKELVEKINQLGLGTIDANWGMLDYRPRQVMEAYLEPRLPGWRPKVSLEQGLLQFFNNSLSPLSID